MERISGQNPQIEGVNLDRYLFDGKVHCSPSPFYILRYDTHLKSLIVNAGAAHGVIQGTEFQASPTQGIDVGKALGTLVVDKTTPFSSIIRFNPSSSTSITSTYPSTVVQTRSGKRESLRLYIFPGCEYQASYGFLRSLLRDPSHDLQNVALVNDTNSAHVGIDIEHDKLIPRLLYNGITQLGFTPRLPPLDARDNVVGPFLESLSRYFWELDRTSNDSQLTGAIELSFYELHECRSPFEGVGRPEMGPMGPNLYQDKKVDIVVKDERYFGIRLKNNGPFDLYPTLSYFDNTDFTNITTHYRPPFSGPYLPDAPLKKEGGSLTLGYGSGGMAPLSYCLEEDQSISVGFLKLLVSTQPLDSAQSQPDQPERWGTLLIPIIQRRYLIPSPPIRLANCWPAPARAVRGRTTSMPCRIFR